MHIIINYKIIIIIIVYKNLMETKLIKFNGSGDISLSIVVCNVLRPLNKKACSAITILQKKYLQSLL